jgi:hypothetical protein
MLLVLVPNTSWITVDALIKDDGVWFYLASEGHDVSGSSRRARLGKLVPHLDAFYAYGMTELGLFATRVFYVVAMGLCSILLYFIYSRFLGIRAIPSLVAATLPNILSGVSEVPAGLNSSYAIWGLLPVLASMVLFASSANNRDISSYFYFGLSYLFFLIAMNFGVATLFLVPNILIFTFFFLYKRPRLATLYIALVLAYSIYHYYWLTSGFSHGGTSTLQDTTIMLSRTTQLLEISRISLFGTSYYSTVVLIIIAIAALMIRPIAKTIFVASRVSFSLQHIAVLGWILTWLAATSIAYAELVHQFSARRHSYVFNYGSILAQVVGLFIVIYSVSLLKKFSVRTLNSVAALLGTLIITHSAWQRYHTGNERYTKYELESKVVREALQKNALPRETQVVILDAFPPHSGSIEANTGYVRYLTGRRDLTSLIGSDDKYPHDLFAEGGGAWGFMRGLTSYRPLVIYRMIKGKLVAVEYLLRVTAGHKGSTRGFSWELYDVNQTGMRPELLASGETLEQYYEIIRNLEAESGAPVDVAFSPGPQPEKLLTEKQMFESLQIGNVLEEEVDFRPGLTLHGLKKLDSDGHYRLIMFLSIGPEVGNNFLPAYLINGKFQVINIAKYAATGQIMRIVSQPIAHQGKPNAIRLGFANRRQKLPLVPLVIESGKEEGRNFILVRD